MLKLKDLVEVAVNNRECVVLKVKGGRKMDLISLGCFDGDETMIRLTKGDTVTCTVFRKNGRTLSWHWGFGSRTLVSPQVETMGRMIQSCIEQDFGICCQR